jgi:sporulation protein YlmC with PRC-barrel domain
MMAGTRTPADAMEALMRGVLRAAALTSLLALPALADPAAAPAEVPAGVFLPTQAEGQYLARDLLLGAKVYNAEGHIIGDIEDLILNAEDNQVEGVVMGTGGFAGFGEKRVAVNLSSLQIKNDNGKVTVSLPQATQPVIDALPAFERAAPPKSLLDRAIEKARELTDKGSVTAKDAIDRAREQAGPALERAREAAKDAYDRAAPAVEKAGEAAKDAYDRARGAVETRPAAETKTPPAAAEPPAPATTPETTPPAGGTSPSGPSATPPPEKPTTTEPAPSGPSGTAPPQTPPPAGSPPPQP